MLSLSHLMVWVIPVLYMLRVTNAEVEIDVLPSTEDFNLVLVEGVFRQKDQICSTGETCKTRNVCPYIQAKYEEREHLGNSTTDQEKRAVIRDHLRSRICNKDHRAFCCPKNNSSTSAIPQLDQSCDVHETCERSKTCPFIKEKIFKRRNATLTEQTEISNLVKSKVCNRQKKAYCCPFPGSSIHMITQIEQTCPLEETCETSETCSYVQKMLSETHSANSSKKADIIKLLKSKVCNKQEKAYCCPKPMSVSCILSNWSEFSPCSVSCRGGVRSRRREVIQEDTNGIALCQDLVNLVEMETCQEYPCPGLPSDSKCNGDSKCVYKEDCQSYKIIEHVPETHPDFQKLEKKWKSRICGKFRGKLCCPESGEYPGNYLPKPGECGKKYIDPSRIIGGANAELGEFPWAVLLGYKVNEKTEFKCGGTLINTRYVLTAAHCNAGITQVSTVIIGELKVDVDPDCPNYTQDPKLCQPKRQVIEVESITMHEDYVNNKLTGEFNINDIALIRLKKEAVLNVAVQPICLPLNKEETAKDIEADNLEDGIVGRDATIVGWGATRNHHKINPDLGVAQNILQKVVIPIVSNDDCKSKLSVLTPEGVDLVIGPKKICAGKEGSSEDSCKGDSGGGMFINRNWWSGNLTHIYHITHYQIGIVSYGYRCGIGLPGVYTRVAQFIPWIKQNIFHHTE